MKGDQLKPVWNAELIFSRFVYGNMAPDLKNLGRALSAVPKIQHYEFCRFLQQDDLSSYYKTYVDKSHLLTRNKWGGVTGSGSGTGHFALQVLCLWDKVFLVSWIIS
jgi:hypothetical protein